MNVGNCFFNYERKSAYGKEFVLLEDLDSGRSLTNAADEVVAALAAGGRLLDGEILLYRDTEGNWDEMVHEEGKFKGFRFLDASSPEEAVRRVAKREAENGLSNR